MFTPSPQLYPFTSKWFDSSAGRIHYLDEGQGPPIVLFHGNPTWSFLYRGIVARLRDRFRAVAVDYPGFGLSERPSGYTYTPAEHARVIGELVDQLDLDGFVTMGQDWGGPISLSIAADRADRVRGLVLGNTWFWPADRLSTRLFARFMSSRRMQRRIIERNYFVERMLPKGVTRKLSDQELDHYRQAQPTPEARVGVAEFPRQILAARPWLGELERRVAQRLADKPVQLVWGMKDFGFPATKTVPRIRRTFRNLALVELPNANHFIQEDAPEEISQAIEKHFE
jgi:haloalkane dehalogenase